MALAPFYQSRAEFLSLADWYAQIIAKMAWWFQGANGGINPLPTEEEFTVYALPETRQLWAYMGETEMHQTSVPFGTLEHPTIDYAKDFRACMAIRFAGGLQAHFGYRFGFGTGSQAVDYALSMPPGHLSPVSVPVELDYSGFAPAAGWPVIRTLADYATVDTREVTFPTHRVNLVRDANDNPTAVLFRVPDAAVAHGRHDLYTIGEGALTTGRTESATQTIELTAPVELLDAIDAETSPNEA